VSAASACAAASGDLTELTWRLLQAHDTLAEQGRTPDRVFGGVSGEAYRIHASHSAASVAELASDVALLAGALAALGRALADVAELRALADGLPPDEAAQIRGRADSRERRAGADWRTAVSVYVQRRWPVAAADQPVVSPGPIRPSQESRPAAPAGPTSAAPSAAAPGGEPAPPPPHHRRDPLRAEIVGPTYEAEIVRPDP